MPRKRIWTVAAPEGQIVEYASSTAPSKRNCDMPKRLTKKLDFEKGKLKSKASQSDYRNLSPKRAITSTAAARLRSTSLIADAAKRDYRGILRDDKHRAIEFYTAQLRTLRVKVGVWRFRFKFTPEQFAKENGIPIREGRLALPAVREEAEQKLVMTLGRARTAQLELYDHPPDRAGEIHHPWRLRFKTFLPSVEPIQWGKLHKRVELCPTELESND